MRLARPQRDKLQYRSGHLKLLTAIAVLTAGFDEGAATGMAMSLLDRRLAGCHALLLLLKGCQSRRVKYM